MTMPAGKYYIGDLCYVMHKEWDEVCSLTTQGDDCLDGEFNLANGVRFASYGTKFGDGSYLDNSYREYGVDAGLIGCILVSDIDTSDTANDVSLGHVVEFDKPFETSGGRTSLRDWDGVIRFGDVRIETDPEEEDDDYEGEDEDDEEEVD